MLDARQILFKGGVIPATPLVLNEKREFDEAGQRRLIRYYLEAGAIGIATAVHSTQFNIRDPKINLLEKVLMVVSSEIDKYQTKTGKRIIKIAGACGKKRKAIAEAKLAKKYGYDFILLSPGGLNQESEEYLLERTKEVGKVLPIIAFYLQVAVGGRIFSYHYWQEISKIKAVVAIKCASFSKEHTIEVVKAVTLSNRSAEIALYTGNDNSIISDLTTIYTFKKGVETYTNHFVGGLLGQWCIWTSKAVETFNSLKEISKLEIATLDKKITYANSIIFDYENSFKGCIPGIHEVLRRQGLMSNNLCLDSKELMSTNQEAKISKLIKDYPELNDDSFVKEFLESDENSL